MAELALAIAFLALLISIAVLLRASARRRRVTVHGDFGALLLSRLGDIDPYERPPPSKEWLQMLDDELDTLLRLAGVNRDPARDGESPNVAARPTPHWQRLLFEEMRKLCEAVDRQESEISLPGPPDPEEPPVC